MLGCTAKEVTMESSVVRMMSFNIRNSEAKDGDNHWSVRKELVVGRIRAFDADVAALQEVLQDQAEYLDGALPEYERFGRGRKADPTQGEQAAIYFRRDRFTRTDGGHFWLSETPSVPGSKSWDTSLERIVTWVELTDRRRVIEPFRVYGTHFDHRGAVARDESAKLIVERVTPHRAIVAGDFNALPSERPHHILTQAFVDTHRAANPTASDTEPTANGFGLWPDGSRIDWILCSPDLKVVDADIDHRKPGGRYPSDHYPVRARIDLR